MGEPGRSKQRPYYRIRLVETSWNSTRRPRRLAYTWRGGSIDTVVLFTLEPVPEGTWLRLEHKGFRGLRGLMVSLILGSGWKKILRLHLPALLARMDGQEEKPEAR